MFTKREQIKIMNNRDKNIAYTALESLRNNTGITGLYTENNIEGIDGTVDLILDNERIHFLVEVKNEIRKHQIDQIAGRKLRHGKDFMVVALNIPDIVKEEFRKLDLAYLDANGNIFFKNKGKHIWFENHKKYRIAKEKVNRAFTKTGLRVVFLFLQDENAINLTYREIAEKADTALGNVNNIINGLNGLKFLLLTNNKKYFLNNKKELLTRWVTAYEEKLKPTLKIDVFDFVNNENFFNWRAIQLNTNRTFWGGEPAGDILTNNLRPGKLILYTNENKQELMKNYRIFPDPDGKITVYRIFWNINDKNNITVPPLLVYTDLINTGDPRCIETGRKVYEQFLKNRFE